MNEAVRDGLTAGGAGGGPKRDGIRAILQFTWSHRGSARWHLLPTLRRRAVTGSPV